jgi:hypothetical protein
MFCSRLGPLMVSQICSAVAVASSADRAAYRRKYDAGSAKAVLRRRRNRSTYHARMSAVAAST